MRTSEVQKLDVSVGRGPKSWTCPYGFNGLQAGKVNGLLTISACADPAEFRGFRRAAKR